MVHWAQLSGKDAAKCSARHICLTTTGEMVKTMSSAARTKKLAREHSSMRPSTTNLDSFAPNLVHATSVVQTSAILKKENTGTVKLF